jgi:hypothetical protein
MIMRKRRAERQATTTFQPGRGCAAGGSATTREDLEE